MFFITGVLLKSTLGVPWKRNCATCRKNIAIIHLFIHLFSFSLKIQSIPSNVSDHEMESFVNDVRSRYSLLALIHGQFLLYRSDLYYSVDLISASWFFIAVPTSTSPSTPRTTMAETTAKTTVETSTAAKAPTRETTSKGETNYIVVKILLKQLSLNK